MTAAFILIINVSVAALFAVAFAVFAATNPAVRGARWLAAAYGVGVLDVALEFSLPWFARPAVTGIAIYLVYLLALTFGLKGLASHYRVRWPSLALGIVWAGAIVSIPFLLTWPYGSTPRLVLYQLPYVAMHLLMIAVVLRSGRRTLLDRLLIGVSGLVALACLSKPAIARTIGAADGPQNYIASQYAAVSQTIGAVALIALALVLMLVIMRDVTIEMVARSETDPLSGVLNRRGFEKHAVRAVERARRSGEPLAYVTLDVDRFKAINDGYGHAEGDRVIVALAALLTENLEDRDQVARMGGEEFALLLSGRTAEDARQIAETIRILIARTLRVSCDETRIVTASFGVAEFEAGDQLSDLGRRSDMALYAAKAAGRNRVSVSSSLSTEQRCAAPQPAASYA
ncbi:GGDEF domain-containing protein [Novosphingobium aquimarinum]|uniref:GGDEF domain-containing protein n=1 Tax=Novosphingobium aquimarinum TaxID=2682494 RepID=UPI0012EC4B5E|nr:GGDEF domain-containing protein [Novosphingobium aquimarinum]